MLFYVFCFLIAHCYLCLNNSNQHEEKCTLDSPCLFQSSIFNSSFSQFNQFVITDDSIPKYSTSLFSNILLFCSKHNIRLEGLNQTIDFSNNFIHIEENTNLDISNFTFINIHSLFINSSNINITFANITFARSKSQLIELKSSRCYFQSCLFNYNYVNNFSLLKFNETIVNFVNCSIQAISQFPKSNFPILYLNKSPCNLTNCQFYANYVNFALFEVHFSHFSISNSGFIRNGGDFLLKSLNNSIICFDSCSFDENSWKLFLISKSSITLSNSSILRNCASDPICSLLNSTASFHGAQFLQNSCGSIIQSNFSSLSINVSFFSNNNSPSDLISIDSSKLKVISTLINHSLTSYGSSISSYYSRIEILNTSFNYTYSRRCGSSIYFVGSVFEGSSLSFFNTSSLSKSTSICLRDCKENPFVISQSVFNNSQKNNLLSVYVDHCPGIIRDSIFSREMDFEIPLVLAQKCTNCSFAQPIQTEKIDLTPVIINDFDSEINMIIIGLISFVVLLILFICFRRKIRMCFNRMTRKRHY